MLGKEGHQEKKYHLKTPREQLWGGNYEEKKIDGKYDKEERYMQGMQERRRGQQLQRQFEESYLPIQKSLKEKKVMNILSYNFLRRE